MAHTTHEMTAANDFNYKVALASGLRDLQSGRFRQAEEQFRYLVTHFPAAGGGYRGLAKVFMEQDDQAAALTTLRAGAASLAKAGDRAGGITLLKEAIPLGPSDAAVHRHLAAALELAGDHDGAVAEQRRFAHAAIDAGDREAALREIRYALRTSGDDPAVVSVAVECGLPVQGFSEGQSDNQSDDQSEGAGEPRAGAVITPAPAPPEATNTWAPAAAPDRPEDERRSLFAAPQMDHAVAAPPVTTSPDAPPDTRSDERPGESADDLAGRYIAARDPRAAHAAIVAAREHLSAGHTHAASDLLLQVIASGLADHQAQRLLVEVATSIGKKDVARAKCALLAQALRLDGQAELAVEVERLAQAV